MAAPLDRWGVTITIRIMMFPCRLVRLLAAFAWVAAVGAVGLLAEDKAGGLVITFVNGAARDVAVRENVQLFVPQGEAPTPFLPAGPFTATWTGFLTSELRAEYVFHAEFNGDLKVTFGDASALATHSADGKLVAGSKVKLNKGPNALKVEYKAPEKGDAFVRLFWSNKEVPITPIPLAVLGHDASLELEKSSQIHQGRDLFAELRCGKCHGVEGGRMAELAADAPALAGLGGRRNFDWMARWILDPSALRPGTPMPAIFSGEHQREDAEAVAAYLSSLKGDLKYEAKTGDATAGKALYDQLHCVACHVAPDTAEAAVPGRISQKGVKAKFAPGALVAFLRQPDEHFKWVRMPNFKLTEEEAAQLAAYLDANAEAPGVRPSPTDPALIGRGRQLIQTSGCLNCHFLEAQNQFATRKLVELPAARWTEGCLADEPKVGGKAPRYHLTTEQRVALRAFAATDRTSLGRQVASDFLERQSQALNCRECHGKVEGFPKYELLTGKLKPEWAAKFIAGREPWKPRPWVPLRMPGFPAYAESLASGLATQGGLPPKTDADPIPENAKELIEAGRKLVSANGGLSCTQCHGVGDFGATAVFEAPGINLAYSNDRIQPSYFRRWIRNPQSVDPETKMPAYFDVETGASPLSDILGGDGPKTIQAVWEYLRLGDKMPRPE